MDQTSAPSQREMVYCHECENEWYRDEHGLVCPECQSDFTEIIEDDDADTHASTADEDTEITDLPPHHPPEGFYAPDPDEDDIENLRWEETAPGRYRVRGTYHTTISRNDGAQPGLGAALTGLVGNLLQGYIGQQQQVPQQQQQPQLPGQAPNDPTDQAPPPPPEQRPDNPGVPSIRHGHGPGYSYTIATSSNATFGGINLGGANPNADLHPRNAHAPQPFQPQPDNINRILQQLMADFGAIPGGQDPSDHPPQPGNPFPFPFAAPTGPNANLGLNLANIMQLFGAPAGGVAGDAVYTQEAFDRIMTQLRERHEANSHGVPAASAAAISALPTKTISPDDIGEPDHGGKGKAECSICMDEVPLGDPVTVLPCSHWFHRDCISAWLAEHDSCPHCRKGITPKEGGGEQPREPGQQPLHDLNAAAPLPSGHFPAAAASSPPPPGSSAGAYDERPQSSGSASGMFHRMREAFSRGDGSGAGGGDAGAADGSGSS